MNVIIYCRVSSDEQAEGTSLDVQEERLMNYCERKGYTVVDVPHREDESGNYTAKKLSDVQFVQSGAVGNENHSV